MEPYRVDWRSPDGRWINGEPVPYARILVTDVEKAAYMERTAPPQIPGLPPNLIPVIIPDWPREIPSRGTTYPMCAPDGHLFVLRSVTVNRPHPEYDIVDRRGVLVERLALAVNQRIVGFGRRAAYIVERDSLDVERLRRYPYPFL
jgi:hypothetical protein